MGRTKLNITSVSGARGEIVSAKEYVSSAKTTFSRTKNSIDNQIKNRSNIAGRLNSAQTQLNAIDSKIARIRNVVDFGVAEFNDTNATIEKEGRALGEKWSARGAVTIASNLEQLFKGANQRNDGMDKVVTNVVKSEAGWLKILEKLFKKDTNLAAKVGMGGSLLSYLGSLYTFCTTEHTDMANAFSGWCGLAKSSSALWKGTYSYYEKTLKPLQASRFGKKYQGKVGAVSLIGNMLGFSGDTVRLTKVILDPNSTGADKWESGMNVVGSGADVGKTAVQLKLGQKVLTRGVCADYKWDYNVKNKGKLDSVNAYLSLVGVAADSLRGGISRYKTVSADGFVDMGDMGEMGAEFAISGLASIVNTATFGISDALGLSDLAGKATDAMTSFAENQGADFVNSHRHSSNYVKNAQFLKDIANDPSQNVIKRASASVVGGIGMIGAVSMDAAETGIKWVGDTVSAGWDALKNLF